MFVLQGRPCQLIVHLERGFSLLEGGLGPTAKAIWTFAFDKLKGSADDGHRLLYLDFGGDDGEIVSLIFVIFYSKDFISKQHLTRVKTKIHFFFWLCAKKKIK